MSAVARTWRGEDGDARLAGGAPGADASRLESGSHEVARDPADPRLARIRAAMEPGAMTIVFQPVIDLRRGVIAGAEALARFAMEPSRTPDVWFNEAWEVDLGVELELLAIRRALDSLQRLPEGAHLAINASAQTLVSPLLDAVLAEVPGHRVTVELTEHAQVDDYANVKAAIVRLRSRGVRLAIDDAGAGVSSLQHILHLRPDLIKLDRSLTQGIDSDPVRYALAAALVTFALSLDAQICAEGIEKDAELAALQHLGIAYGQGYYLGRPLPLPLAPPPKGVWLSESTASVQHERVGLRSLPPGLGVGLARGAGPGKELVDARQDEAFDRITRWASALLSAPVAVFSVLDGRRQLFKSSVGLPEPFATHREAPAAQSLCQHVVASRRPLSIGDTRRDPLARLSRMVSQLGASAYLGVPVRGDGGELVGTLCVVDQEPRAWTLDDERVLSELSASLTSELELRSLRKVAAPRHSS